MLGAADPANIETTVDSVPIELTFHVGRKRRRNRSSSAGQEGVLALASGAGAGPGLPFPCPSTLEADSVWTSESDDGNLL